MISSSLLIAAAVFAIVLVLVAGEVALAAVLDPFDVGYDE